MKLVTDGIYTVSDDGGDEADSLSRVLEGHEDLCRSILGLKRSQKFDDWDGQRKLTDQAWQRLYADEYETNKWAPLLNNGNEIITVEAMDESEAERELDRLFLHALRSVYQSRAKKRTITNQVEWDVLPAEFAQTTKIEIRSDRDRTVFISAAPIRSTILVCNESHVVISGSARVEAHDSASVVANDSATVDACDSARVIAYNSATVVAYDSARVAAYDLARVIARDSAMVIAWDSTSVEAHESTSVEAHDSAKVYRQ